MKIPVVILLWASHVTFATGSTVASELAQDLEREIPGSVNWLTRWAIIETALDKLEAIFNGRARPPRGYQDARAVAYYTLSMNPEMLNEEFQQHMLRIFRQPGLLSAEWKATAMSIFTVPD